MKISCIVYTDCTASCAFAHGGSCGCTPSYSFSISFSLGDGMPNGGVSSTTRMWQLLATEPGDKEGILGKLVDRNPIKRKAEPSDISSVVVFLCFSAASYVAGQVIYVDGGFTVSGFPNPSPDHDED
ncbi:hypothetical protein F8388_011010 [Cannabis sativa]|uniref:Uncharacterized protein n=1 Tax=Cannabis sativa TaxID=3483 RepID=A0A7J6FQJ8_CANSA|nr:hypothetical protein F8388_011010 [Cannabis sativa]